MAESPKGLSGGLITKPTMFWTNPTAAPTPCKQEGNSRDTGYSRLLASVVFVSSNHVLLCF
jgi:hypothetical protein